MQGLVLLQLAIRNRLVATPAVTALVPAAHILDRGGRPEVFPSIILGEDQSVDRPYFIDRRLTLNDLFSRLHIWTREGGLYDCKQIAAAVSSTLIDPLGLGTSQPRDLIFENSRFLRDPDGVTAHGIMTFRMLYFEAA